MRNVLLKKVMVCSVHPGLGHLFQDLKLLVGVDLESHGEEVGEHDVALVADQAQHHHSGRGHGRHHDREPR